MLNPEKDHKKKNILELTRLTTEDYHSLRKLPLILLADNVRSALNIGAMLRTSDALLVGEMIMAGISAVPPSAEISKTALGAEDSVMWRHVGDAVEEVRRLRRKGAFVCVLEQAHDSVSLADFRLPPLNAADPAAGNESNSFTDVLLVVGNEVSGVDQRIVDMADMILEIPMHGIKHSLNVSTSAGIALWEMYKKLNKYL